MWALRFTAAARAEVIVALDWYETEVPGNGLGQRFVAEVGRVVKRVSEALWQFPLVYKTVRRARLKRFPYSLFFVALAHELLVIACFHGRRHPKRWQSRV